MDLSAEVYVCCEIPWASTTIQGNYFAAQVNTHFGDKQIPAMVTVTTLDPGSGFGEGINPYAYMGAGGRFDEEPPDWMMQVGFGEPDASPPRSSVSLKIQLPDWTGLYVIDEHGDPLRVTAEFEVLYECIIFAINQALYSIVEGEPIRVGPLSHGDLIGNGIARITPAASNESFYVRLPSTTPLGSYNSGLEGHPAVSDEQLEMPNYELSASEPTRRLFSWMRRSMLRAHRKEWAEAIVAQQASLEDWMHYLICAVAADHGYTSTEFEAAGFEDKNAAETFGILAAHLGGDSSAASAAQKRVWKNRNSVVHRGERGTEALYEESYESTLFIQNWMHDRLLIPDIARRHPISSWVLHHDDSPLKDGVRDAVSSLLSMQGLTSLPTVNNLRPLDMFPARNIVRPSTCWGKNAKFPRPFDS
ncbi:hypothetical protein ABZ867_16835 [Streptomyces cinnamoneus]